MSTSAPAPVMLSQGQADKILQYAIENRMYETGAEGLDAVDPQTRLNDAATLAFQAKRAFENGNKSEAVKEVLFIAEVDMTPPEQQAATPAPVPAPVTAPANGASQYANHTNEQLEQALGVFRSSPANPAIQAEIQQIEAVLAERRASAQATPAPQPAQEVAPTPQPPAAPAAPGAGAPLSTGQPASATPGPAATAPAAAEPHFPPAPPTLPPIPGRPNPGVISPGGQPDAPGTTPGPPQADAAAVPGASAPQPSSEGSPPAVQAPAQDGARLDLERLLTYEMMQTYGLTVDGIKALSDDQLRTIIANPGGQQPQPAAGQPAVTPEREALEAMITGPMLKAWSRGRRDVPGLSDDDLRKMVENPGGPSIPPGPAAAAPAPPAPVPAPQTAPPQQEAAVAPTPEQPPAPSVTAAPATSVPVSRPQSDADRVGEAMEIIQREHLPIPPDIEDPYRLPNDVSKVSDDELRSLHARAHATEARVNWIVSERDDEVEDLNRLLADRRRVVKLETPTTQESKRLTKDQIEARIEADEEVGRLKARISEVQKGTGKLKVIRDNAHRDCERLSRQWSMRFKEESFSPTR